MDAVTLQQLCIERDTLHEKLYPRYFVFGGYLAKDVFERVGVSLTVVRRYANAEQDDGGTGLDAAGNDLVEITLHAARRNATEAIIGAQLKNDQRRIEGAERVFDARCAAFSSFTADAGVNDPMFVPLSFEACLQQCGPGLVNVYAVSCAQAVAKHENGRRFRTVSAGGHE